MMPRSLRFQLLSRSLLILAALLALIGVFQYIYMQQFLYHNRAESMNNQALSMSHQAWFQAVGIGSRDDHGRPLLFMPESTVAFVAPDGTVTKLSGDRDDDGPAVPILDAALYQSRLSATRKPGLSDDYTIARDGNGVKQLVVLQTVGLPGRNPVGLIQVSVRTDAITAVLIRQLVTFLSLAAMALIAGLLTFLPVLRRTLVPLNNMVRTVGRIDAGKLAVRLPEGQGQEEIDRLSASFNGMLTRLETSFKAEQEAKEQMRRFVADASHELRTPLTSIHGFLEVLLRGAVRQPEQLEKSLRSMYGESERMNKLVQDLLLLAKMDRMPTIDLQAGELEPLVREMEPHLRLLGGRREVNVEVRTNARVRYDADKVKQALLNLFHNAVQHTDQGTGRIDVRLTEQGRQVVLAIADNGPGIPPEHAARIFDRFYRIDTARSRKYGGAGLGLSITKSIMDLHEGEIEVVSEEGKGTEFRLKLPKT